MRLSLHNLLTFPCVEQRVAKGSLRLHGAWFDVSEGELHLLEPARDGSAPSRTAKASSATDFGDFHA